jgi:aryl-alcohol dehydrogenase-like predicted oxidoreductase
MNPWALGTVQFGIPYGVANQQGKVKMEAVKDILTYARSAGVDTLDTAVAYGDSEERLGYIGVESWKVISKLPKIPKGTYDILSWVRQTVDCSLDQMQLSKMYSLLLHHPEQLLHDEGRDIYKALVIMKKEGLVEKIGVSIYSTKELDAISGYFDFDLVQSPYNILDRNLVNSGWLYRLQESGVEIHARSVFLQGLLLMNPQKRPEKFNRWQSLWHQWDKWLKTSKISALEACLNYVLSFREISKIVVGVESILQLKEILNIKKVNMEFPSFLACNDPDLIYPFNWKNL